jgi:TonB family protein
VLTDIFGPQSRNSVREVAASVPLTVEIIGMSGALDKVPAPDLQLESVPVDSAGLQEIDFDDSVQDELSAVTAPVSAPHLARVQSVDPVVFAHRAHLAPGTALTVLLRLEVREDGFVGSADIVRSSGNAVADAAALDYALALRWVPGTNGGSPRTMRVDYPVTLALPRATPRVLPSQESLCRSQLRMCGGHGPVTDVRNVLPGR